MPVDGPQDLTHAEIGRPLVEPASQQCSDLVAGHWNKNLDAAAVQPPPQHSLKMAGTPPDVPDPILRPLDGQPGSAAHNDKLQREPYKQNLAEIQMHLRQSVLTRMAEGRRPLRSRRFRRKGENRPGAPLEGAHEDARDGEQTDPPA